MWHIFQRNRKGKFFLSAPILRLTRVKQLFDEGQTAVRALSNSCPTLVEHKIYEQLFSYSWKPRTPYCQMSVPSAS